MRIAIRGFAGKERVFEDRVEIQPAEVEQLVPSLALKHAAMLAAHKLHMIEIEFLDEPNPQERFFRFGSDPRGMVLPIAVVAEDPQQQLSLDRKPIGLPDGYPD